MNKTKLLCFKHYSLFLYPSLEYLHQFKQIKILASQFLLCEKNCLKLIKKKRQQCPREPHSSTVFAKCYSMASHMKVFAKWGVLSNYIILLPLLFPLNKLVTGVPLHHFSSQLCHTPSTHWISVTLTQSYLLAAGGEHKAFHVCKSLLQLMLHSLDVELSHEDH